MSVVGHSPGLAPCRSTQSCTVQFRYHGGRLQPSAMALLPPGRLPLIASVSGAAGLAKLQFPEVEARSGSNSILYNNKLLAASRNMLQLQG